MKIENIHKYDFLIISILIILFGLFCLYKYFFYQNSNAIPYSNLKHINGELKKNYVIKRQSRSVTYYKYYIYLNGYNSSFVINSEKFKYFKQKDFEQNVKIGTKIKIGVLDKDYADIQYKEIEIYGLSDSYNWYMSEFEALKKNTEEGLYFGIGIIIFGLYVLITKHLFK